MQANHNDTSSVYDILSNKEIQIHTNPTSGKLQVEIMNFEPTDTGIINLYDGTQYLHFKGENVIQKIEIKNNGEIKLEEGANLHLPKFWETNWDVDDFISRKNFNKIWENYSKK